MQNVVSGRIADANPDSILQEMLDALGESPEIYRPSKYWQYLASVNRESLKRDGYANFKRTVNQNYFNFAVLSKSHPQFRAAFRLWIRSPSPRIAFSRWESPPQFEIRGENVDLNTRQAFLFRVFTSMLWDIARMRDPDRIADGLEEPSEGKPLAIRYRGRRISQDLANSILEYSAIRPHLHTERPTILELGAGYGRLAFVCMKALPCRYIIADIPPALYIAQRYLTAVMPGKRIFRFRSFDNFERVQREFEQADLAFLLPHQLELIPSDRIDVFINISSLQEMTREQISHYFSLIARLRPALFYTKQWYHSPNPYDGLAVSAEDYPVRKSWERIFFRPAAVQTEFFEALYRVRADDSRAVASRPS